MNRWTGLLGRLLCVVGLAGWLGWSAWRVSSPMDPVTGVVALVLELVAISGALIVTAGLWSADGARRHRLHRPATQRSASPSGRAAMSTPSALPTRMLHALDLDPDRFEPTRHPSADIGPDDTGEIAWARRGLLTLTATSALPSTREAAWSVVAIDGLRRMLMVGLLVFVLFTGRAPFAVPPLPVAALLGGSVGCLAIGHWLLSERLVWPGSRLLWSMASIGAGFGDGTSRTGLPIRWTATMATMVVLNLAVSLRGMSDRWTHGLGAMAHGDRVAAMATAFALVLTGFAALRTLPQPNLDFYGATRRLEESSARRLALGATAAVALLGFIAGALPATTPL